MSANGHKHYEFGSYRLDTQKRFLWRGEQAIALNPKAMDILLVLIERGGEVVSKAELMEAVWPNSFVEESNLNQNVFLLRKALGETAQDRNYVVTVPGKGYRFGADVQEVAGSNGARTFTHAAAIPSALPAVQGVAVQEKTAAISRRWLLVAALLVLTSGVAYLGLRSRRIPPRAGTQRIVIAVLPFVNLTGDSSQDYFSDGLTEEMITQLGGIDPQHMGVIARGSVMRFKGGSQGVEEIGRELGVDYVLEGSVRRDSQKVRITAQLIQIKDQTHLWTGEYDRELSGLLALQSAISQQIADQIQLTLGSAQSVKLAQRSQLAPAGYEAYDLYLKGRYFWAKRTPQGFERAIGYFQQAISKDPSYARAYVSLADSYVLISGYSLSPASEFMPKARAAAQRAIELDDSLAEAHTALALIAQDYDWNWDYAGKEYRRALQLDPNDATAHHWYAEHLALRGQFDQALSEIERARQLDPLSLIIGTDYGAILYFSRSYNQSIPRFRAVLEMEPNFPRAHMLTFAYAQNGQIPEALADLENSAPNFRRTLEVVSARLHLRPGPPARQGPGSKEQIEATVRPGRDGSRADVCGQHRDQ